MNTRPPEFANPTRPPVEDEHDDDADGDESIPAA
jgi:hypothetical protein